MSDKIETKLETLVEEVLGMEPEEKGFKPKVLEYRERQFRIGAQFLRDKNMNDRIKVGQMLRVVAMITQDPEVRKEYIKASQPKMLPQLESRPK